MQHSRILTALRKYFGLSGVYGGLEVSDSVVRFAHFDGASWQLRAVRLPAGVIADGEILDEAAAIRAFQELSKGLRSSWFHQSVRVIVALSPVAIYSEVFTLPNVGENLDAAMDLNLRMVSPIEFSAAYAGREILTVDTNVSQIEVLGVFAKRDIVDRLNRTVLGAGFLPVAIESKARSLIRGMAELSPGFKERPGVLVLMIDDEGIDVIIARNGRLYFEYMSRWQDVRGGERDLTDEIVVQGAVRSVVQVMNFYRQHWQEPISAVIIAAPPAPVVDTIGGAIAERLSLPIENLAVSAPQGFPPEWLSTIGAAFRSSRRDANSGASVLGIEAAHEFSRREIVNVLQFSRVLVPVALLVLALIFGGGIWFASHLKGSLSTQLAGTPSHELEMFEGLEKEATAFNERVALYGTIQSSRTYLTPVVVALYKEAAANRILISRLSFSGGSVDITGAADAEDKIIQFKNSLAALPFVKDVQLPLTGIRQESGGVLFSIHCTIDLAAVSKMR